MRTGHSQYSANFPAWQRAITVNANPGAFFAQAENAKRLFLIDNF